MALLRTFLLVLAFMWCAHVVSAQQNQVYKPAVSRILFVLDGSGSMKQDWYGKTKFETARQLLFKLIDSVERKNPNVEFAVRVFGFQNPREARNCTDSKLVIPFGKNNAEKINSRLSSITPQGMSPIAYSIQQGAKDFPDDAKSLNSIILITDGEENCGGGACDAAKNLVAKRITLKPFIVGLNVDTTAYSKLNCIGTFYDTKDEPALYKTVGVIIRQTLNTTTVQVNLLDKNNEPTVTNVPFTLYDHYSGKMLYNFVHAMNEKGFPDTMYLDPVGVYDLELHTTPAIKKENIELVPGKHNIIAVDAPVADLTVECYGATLQNNDAQVLVRPAGKNKPLTPESILNVQNLNEPVKYLANDYRLEILTTPPLVFDTGLVAFTDNKMKVAGYGTLAISSSEKWVVSVFTNPYGNLKMVDRFETISKTENRKLQPGEYRIVYQAKANYSSETTQTLVVKIEEGRTIVLNLQ